IVFRLNSKEAVDWVKDRMDGFTAGMGGQAIFKERLYNTIGEFVPKTFEPKNDQVLRSIEQDNNLPDGSISVAKYLKPIDRHKSTQKVAHVVLGFDRPSTANKFLRHGIFVEGKRVHGRKLLVEPVRCLNCQKIGTGHVAVTCPDKESVCARCGRGHRTGECMALNDDRKCSNCRDCGDGREYEGHGAADCQCPVFLAKLQASLECNPDAKYTYFPEADDESTWIEVGKNAVDEDALPEWQAVMRARNKRAGAPQQAAVELQRAMTGGARGKPKGMGMLRQMAITEAFGPTASRGTASMVMGTDDGGPGCALLSPPARVQ
ncbi:hypothetical protein C8F01DRAFT_985866, partial [Mycena amicta]